MITKFLTPDNILFLSGIIKNYITEELIKIAEGVEVTLVGQNVSIDADSNIPAYKPININVEEDNGYCIDSITVLMGEEDITSSTWNSSTGTISIPLVTGDISITVETHYLLTTTLENLTLSWDTLKKGQSFTASFVGEDNNVLLPSTVNVTMGGIDITDTALRVLTNTIEIPSVTDTIEITAQAAAIPNEYAPLMYIRNTNVSANVPSLKYRVFNTGHYPTDLTEVELDVNMVTTNNYGALFGVFNGNSQYFMMYSRYGNVYGRAVWGNETIGSTAFGDRQPREGDRITIRMGKGTATYPLRNGTDKTITFDGSTLETPWTSPYPLTFGGEQVSENVYRGKNQNIYNFKVWEDGLLIRRYVPCKRISDNFTGFWDLVNETFLTEKNTANAERADWIPPYVALTNTLSNCTAELLTPLLTSGTTAMAVIGSTWSVKLTPNTNAIFNSSDAVVSLVIGGIDVTNLTNDDMEHTPYVQYDSTTDTYTITIVNVPQESIEISAIATEIVETEYVESDGVGFISTSYIPDGNNIKIITKMNLVRYSTSESWRQWFGSYTTEQANCYRIIRSSNSNTNALFYNNTPAGGGGTSIQISLNSIHEIELAFGTCKIDGVTHSITTRQFSSTTANTSVMRLAGPGTVGRYYYMQIYDGEDLKLDLIPVRVGTRAGMKDNVSGKIFYPSSTSVWTYKDLEEVSNSLNLTPNEGLTLDNDEEETI